MNLTFRKGIRENVGLWINLVGGTGSGKTFSALRLASGMAGDKPFALIDTENRRALHYADQFSFDHADLRAPFRPESYADAIMAADNAGYPVIVVDSGSHVWAGDGGVLDWQDEELDRMAGSDYKKREQCKMAAWIKPKMAHKQMVQKLLQIKAHLILCFRAEQKIEMVRDDKGKLVIQEKQSMTGLHGWIPICEKMLPFEATASFLMTADKPGIPQPIKLQEQHRRHVKLDAPLDEAAGRTLSQWASGGESSQMVIGEMAYVTADQALSLDARCTENNIPVDGLKRAAKVERLAMIHAADYERANGWITAAINKRKEAEAAET